MPYLNNDIIKKFGNLVIKTADGLELKINLLILVSVSQMFKDFLNEINDDVLDVVILSEFQSLDLKLFRDFIMEGYLPGLISSKVEQLFQSFGINLSEIVVKKNKELTRYSYDEHSFQDQEVKLEDDNFKLAEIVPEIKKVIPENSPNDKDNYAFDESFEEDYDVIVSKTEHSFNDIISEIGDNNESLKQGNKLNEVKQESFTTFQKRSQENSFQNDETDDVDNKNQSKKLKLDQEVLLWVGSNKSKLHRKKSQKRKQKSLLNNKASILETNTSLLVDDEDDELWQPDQDISQISNITSQITGVRISLNRGQGTYIEISYETLCSFKDKVKNNFDIKIPTPGFTQEDFKDFKFPENLEDLEVVPSVLADVEHVTPKNGTAQCGVCGIFGLNTYKHTRDHHIRFHTIHYECPIEDCR